MPCFDVSVFAFALSVIIVLSHEESRLAGVYFNCVSYRAKQQKIRLITGEAGLWRRCQPYLHYVMDLADVCKLLSLSSSQLSCLFVLLVCHVLSIYKRYTLLLFLQECRIKCNEVEMTATHTKHRLSTAGSVKTVATAIAGIKFACYFCIVLSSCVLIKSLTSINFVIVMTRQFSIKFRILHVQLTQSINISNQELCPVKTVPGNVSST